jgi:threonine aldolase
MDFRSDNTAAAAPEILSALAAANTGTRTSYGEDPQTARLEQRLKELFETDLAAYCVATGTAANALGLSLLSPPYGAVYCHEEAHILVDECGAPEFYCGGARMVGLPGDGGKITAAQLRARLPDGAGEVHHVQPAAISLTQATEAGTVYRAGEIAAIAEVAREHHLRVHMDGARFANALAFLQLSPAEATWRAGVEVLSFGASKNGALAAEMVILFDRSLAHAFEFRRKRAGHLFSKMRFLTAQFEAYLTDGLWLRLATRANGLARRLADGLARLPGVHLCYPVEANEVFVDLPEPVIAGLLAEGFQFYRWPGAHPHRVRLVAAFNTEEAHITALIASAARHAATPLAVG